MPSTSLIRWAGPRTEALDEIEHAHVRVGGSERGRRYATLQINFAYTAILSSHFQGFCRDLHSECVDHLATLVPVQLQSLFRLEFVWNRQLGRGNPHPGAIGSDFNRLGIDFWTEVYARDARNERRRGLIQELVEWRNAIAHQDFDTIAPGRTPTLHLARVRGWRTAANALAHHFDGVARDYLKQLLHTAPW